MQSANFLGDVGGAAYDGRAMFYKDVVMLGDLRLGAGSRQTTLTSLLDLKTPLASPTFAGTTTCDSIKVNNIFTDSPEGLAIAGVVNTLGALTVNGSVAITENLTVTTDVTCAP